MATTSVQAAPADEEVIQILGINDFHGRIKANQTEAGAAVVAGAVKQLRVENPNTVFAAAGDLIGASTFESFINHDKPTIDALNEAGLDVSAVGNHEFDQGYDDLINRVMAPFDPVGNEFGGAEWEYVGANVKKKADGTQADGLEPSWVQTFNPGAANEVQVGFIGAVTEHLDELVSPAGIADIEAVDIPTAVNAEADALTAAGVDIVVLLVHEGAATTNIADATDPASDFGKIVNGVDDDVDAIISGHTHLAYNHTIAGRPVVSAGQYGYNLNQLNFTYDTAEDTIVSVDQAILPLVTTVPPVPPATSPTYEANYPADAPTAAIVSAAVADAEVKGAVKIGEIAGPFKRARLSDGTTENRGGESSLGNLVAEVQRAQTPASIGGAEIAFMNPGGLRADMVGTAGDLTYKQAADVQPFANTLVRLELTGAQLKDVLEEQWQPDGSQRPFLRLGISKGFTYSYDPTAVRGKRVTGMWLNGTAVKPGQSYGVTANSFLAAGGDNFGSLADGANQKDTGVTDLQAMVDYMDALSAPVEPDFSQRSVGATLDKVAYAPGDTAQVALSSLRMTGPDDVTDAEVTVTAQGGTPVTVEVDNTVGAEVFDEAGRATVGVPIPAGAKRNAPLTVTVTGATTGTAAVFTLPIAPKAAAKVKTKVKPKKVKAKKTNAKLVITVSAKGVSPTGKVKVKANGKTKTVKVNKSGKATVKLGKFKTKGKKKVVITYLGDGNVKKQKKTIKVKVVK